MERIEVLSRVIEQDFGVPLRIGVGIHVGPVIVGKVGPSDDLRFGLVGATVNIASRLEGQTKLLGSPLLVSQAVAEQLIDRDGLRIGPAQDVQLKGVEGAFVVRAIEADGSIAALQQTGA
jgi:adenylate cyclase